MMCFQNLAKVTLLEMQLLIVAFFYRMATCVLILTIHLGIFDVLDIKSIPCHFTLFFQPFLFFWQFEFQRKNCSVYQRSGFWPVVLPSLEKLIRDQDLVLALDIYNILSDVCENERFLAIIVWVGVLKFFEWFFGTLQFIVEEINVLYFSLVLEKLICNLCYYFWAI